MKAAPRPYAGARIAFATVHGKEALAQQPFRDILVASVVAPAGLNTDQFGTFSGEIPRILTPHAAARAKVHWNVASTLKADILPLQALDMAAFDAGGNLTGLTPHSGLLSI